MTMHVTDLLSPYLDGDLNAQQQAEIETHLSACPSCQEELILLKKTVELVQNFPLREPPPGFLFQVNRRIAEDSWWRRLRDALFAPPSVKLPLQAFAAVAAVALVVFLYSSFEKRGGIPQGQEMRGAGGDKTGTQGAEQVLSPPRWYRVTVPTVVRDQPTETGKEVAQLQPDTPIRVVAIAGEWLKVGSPSNPLQPQGYVRKADTQPE